MKLLSPFLKLPRWLLTCVCLILIMYLTLVPQPLPDNDIPFWEHTDKIVHAIMFGALYVCVGFDLWRGARASRRCELWLLCAVVAFGGLIEIAQQVMALGRGGSSGDLAADGVGALLALVLLHKFSD